MQYQNENNSDIEGEDIDVDVIGDEDEMYHNSQGAIP
jgi:hypothetical protein